MGKNTHTPVTLRRRVLPSGNTSLYLDIYERGERHCEHLRLYLIPENGKADKAANRETLRLAEDIAARRLADILEFKRTGRTVTRMTFGDWFSELTECKRGGTKVIWRTIGKTLQRWRGWRVALADIGKDDAIELRHVLADSGLSVNSQRNYFGVAQCAMNTAVKREMLVSSPLSAIDRPKAEQTERCHLTLEELKMMAETPCKYDAMKRVFMFSSLTGLRRSDIIKLEWSEVSPDNTRIVFRQKKTGGQEYLDISKSAAEWLPPRGTGRVFDTSMMCIFRSHLLREWASAAGVDKPITFHSARHTFACMMLELDVDLYTISKLLGHSDIKTTQVYAKVVDKRKREAVGKIPSFAEKSKNAPKI